MDAIVVGRKVLPPETETRYFGFVDMSGGSADDATLGISHRADDRIVLDLVVNQGPKPPFNPRRAVEKFAAILKEYSVTRVVGDRYAGETFRQDFSDNEIAYEVSALTKSQLYESVEPKLNAGEVELLDAPMLQEQFLGLVWRGPKIDHLPNEHDDIANAAAGAIHLAGAKRTANWGSDVFFGPSLVSANPDWEGPGGLAPWDMH